MIAEHGEQVSTTKAKHRWQIQSNAIEHAMQKHGLRTNEISGSVGSDTLRFNIRTQLDLGIEKLRSLARDFSKSLGSNGIRVDRIMGGLRLEVPRSDNVAVPLIDLLSLQNNVPSATATLGLGESGEMLLHRFTSSASPHLLVAGGPDSGKTTLLRTIAASLAMSNRQSAVQIVAICPNVGDHDQHQTHAASWLPVNYLPHMLCDVAVKHTDIVDVLLFLKQEMEYRETHSFSEPRVIVLIDQVDTIIERGGRQCAGPIHRLVQKGEDVGIHLVLSARSADSGVLSKQLLTDIPVQIFGKTDQDPSRTLLPGSGEFNSRDLLGEGDFLVRRGGQITHMQAALIDDYDLHLRLTEMYRPQAILLAQPFSTGVQIKQPQPQVAVSRSANNVEIMAAVPS